MKSGQRAKGGMTRKEWQAKRLRDQGYRAPRDAHAASLKRALIGKARRPWSLW